MSKISSYFGLKANPSKSAYSADSRDANEQAMGTPVVFTALLALLCLAAALLGIPSQGVPSRLFGYLEGVAGGTDWISEQGLPTAVVALAWGAYFFWYALLLALFYLLYRAANTARLQGAFTGASLRAMKQLNLLLASGYAVYLLLDYLTGRLIAGALGYDAGAVPGPLSRPEFLPIYLAVTVLWFTLGALERGGALQEEADATI